jgi:hypothetical protein
VRVCVCVCDTNHCFTPFNTIRNLSEESPENTPSGSIVSMFPWRRSSLSGGARESQSRLTPSGITAPGCVQVCSGACERVCERVCLNYFASVCLCMCIRCIYVCIYAMRLHAMYICISIILALLLYFSCPSYYLASPVITWHPDIFGKGKLKEAFVKRYISIEEIGKKTIKESFVGKKSAPTLLNI